MSSTTAPAQLWSTMPGWGIAADLTPPELTNSRQLGLLRKWLGIALILLLVAVAGAYVLADRQNSSAAHALTQVQSRTAQLQAEAAQYNGVTEIQGDVNQVQTEIAGVMASDVDLVKLIDQIHGALPSTMTINSEAISISPAGAASAANAGSGLDTSGLANIGTVKLAGNARTLDDLPAFVDHLRVLPGVVDVLPVSNQSSDKQVTYTLSLSLNTTLISHRFDASTTGSK